MQTATNPKFFSTWKMINFVDAIEDEDDVLVEPNEDYEEHIIERDCYIIHQGKKNTLIDIVSFARDVLLMTRYATLLMMVGVLKLW